MRATSDRARSARRSLAVSRAGCLAVARPRHERLARRVSVAVSRGVVKSCFLGLGFRFAFGALHPCGRDRRARDAVFVERQVDPTRCAPSLCSDSEHRTRSNKHRSRTVELSTRSWLAHLGQPAAQLQLTLTHITVHVDDGCTVPGTVTRSRPRSRPARISIDVESTCSPRRPSSIEPPLRPGPPGAADSEVLTAWLPMGGWKV